MSNNCKYKIYKNIIFNTENNIVILLVLIIMIFNFREINKDKFLNSQSNYLENIKKLENQNKYKYELSNALFPTPKMQNTKYF